MDIDGASIGLAGAAQLIRIHRKVQIKRRGVVVKTTEESVHLAASLRADQADPERLLALVRGYWAIEIKQHYRRDHTQREDHCQVRHCAAARNLSLMRTLCVFLYEQQRARRGGKTSLPDWQRRNLRRPCALATLFVG